MTELASGSEPLSPFSAALSVAMSGRALDSHQLSRRLADIGVRVSASTIRSWRSGRRRPEGPASHEAVTAIEVIIGVPSGSLSSQIGRSRRVGPPRYREAVVDQWPAPEILTRLFRDAGLTTDTGVTLLTARHVVDVGPDRRVTTIATHVTLRALRDGLAVVPMIYKHSEAEGTPDIQALYGGRYGPTVSDPATGLFVAPFYFERVLGRGETVVTGDVMTWQGRGDPAPIHSTILEHRADEVSFVIRFTAGDMPRTVHLLNTCDNQTDVEISIGTTSISCVGQEIGPGALGLHWEW